MTHICVSHMKYLSSIVSPYISNEQYEINALGSNMFRYKQFHSILVHLICNIKPLYISIYLSGLEDLNGLLTCVQLVNSEKALTFYHISDSSVEQEHLSTIVVRIN